jgi:hypothetical protein
LQLIFLNKEKYGEDYIKKVLEIRYPYLLPNKKDNESYRKFYAKNIYYISKLKEDYNLEYNFQYITPQNLYKIVKALNIFINLPSPIDELNSFILQFSNGYSYSIFKWPESPSECYIEQLFDSNSYLVISSGDIHQEEILDEMLELLKKYKPISIDVNEDAYPIYFLKLTI